VKAEDVKSFIWILDGNLMNEAFHGSLRRKLSWKYLKLSMEISE
jgi:hypothetical protein